MQTATMRVLRRSASVCLRTLRIGLPVTLCFVMGLGQPWLGTAHAQNGGMSLIRDAEIEDTIRLYATPLFEAAGLVPESIKIHIVDEKQLNAFVSEGRHMFLYTGLLLESPDPNVVIGVIAHETGHISGGHMVRVRGAYESASSMAILATLLGVAVGVLGGGGAGAAVGMAGQGVGERSFLAFSRNVESSADQAGLSFLDATQQSARGLLSLFEKLGESELFITNSQTPYMLTHPLSSERIQAVEAHIARSPWSDTPEAPEIYERHARLQAKLYGYLMAPRETYIRYPESDQSVAARYARTLALHKEHLDEQAMALMDGLIAEEPENGFFWELKGQMLFDLGRYDDAVAALRTSIELEPGQPLIEQLLARVLTERNGPGDAQEAIAVLESAIRVEGDDPSSWATLGKAYALAQDFPMSDVAAAEAAWLMGRIPEARARAERALQGLPNGSAAWIRAQDIMAVTTQPDES